MAWKRGQSGNPTGRPKGSGEAKELRPVRVLAKEFCTEAIHQLVAIGKDINTPPQVRVNAWDIVLQRGDGKPMQQIDIEQRGTVVHLGFLQSPPTVEVIDGSHTTPKALPEASHTDIHHSNPSQAVAADLVTGIEASQTPAARVCVSNQPHSAASKDDENA